jgi:hypothetical protein
VTLTDSFVGANVEDAAPVQSIVVLSTRCSSSSARARAAYWRRLNAGVDEAYRQMAPAAKPAREWEQFTCNACAKQSWRRIASGKYLCPKCAKGATR